MADSQTLFDTLAGSFGHGVDRPALNAFVANSQATNGLRTAQTDEALNNAQLQQEELQAHARLKDSLMNLKDDAGNSMHTPSQADLVLNTMLGKFGSFKDVEQGLHEAMVNRSADVLGNASKLGTPDQTAAQQLIEGKVATPTALPDNYTAPTGTAIHPGQTAHGAAITNDVNSQARLRDAQTAAGGFRPAGAGGANDPQAIALGAYQFFKTGKLPPLGMGGGPAKVAMMNGAAQLAQREANGEDVSNPGFDHMLASGQDFTAGQRSLNSYAGGPIGNQVRSTNNVVGHLQLMENLFTALQNGDTQALNSLRAGWKKQFGSEAPTDIQTAAQVIGPELTKILTNTGAGTGEERQGFGQTAGNLANAPEQTAGAIGTLKGMLGRQAADYALQYHGATGRSDFAKRYLQPDVARYLDLDEGGGQQNPGAMVTPGAAAGPTVGGAPVKIANDDEFNKLHSGAHFIGPDGHERIKP